MNNNKLGTKIIINNDEFIVEECNATTPCLNCTAKQLCLTDPSLLNKCVSLNPIKPTS